MTRAMKTGKSVVTPEAMREAAERSRNIPLRTPDDAEYDELTTADEAPRGRVIKTVDDARGADLEQIMRRLDKLESTMNAAAWEINAHNKFLVEFRAAFSKQLFYPFYRFFVWLFPIPLPPYKPGKTVPYIVRRDQEPVFVKRGKRNG